MLIKESYHVAFITLCFFDQFGFAVRERTRHVFSAQIGQWYSSYSSFAEIKYQLLSTAFIQFASIVLLCQLCPCVL